MFYFRCNGVRWRPTGLGCTFLAIPPESYVSYDKTKSDQTIYVIERYVNCTMLTSQDNKDKF